MSSCLTAISLAAAHGAQDTARTRPPRSPAPDGKMGRMERTPHDPLIAGPFTRVLLELRWGDMDAYGHVNNVTQVRLLEEARVRAFGSPTAARDAAPSDPVDGAVPSVFGVPIPPVFRAASADTDILVSTHTVEYRLPIPYREGPIAVDVVISRVSPVTITVGYVVLEPDESRVYTVAETDVVFVDPDSGRARRLREDEVEALGRVVVDPIPLKRRR